jgi:bifunctional non-homologous end joining protein LigD
VLSEYTPMAPTRVREPFHRNGWVYEEKVDGWRMLAYKDGGRVRLLSRSGRDHTRRFHDIATAVSKLPARSIVLDGEVAIYDQQLRSRFDWLREPDPDAIATPPMFMVFDVLHRDGRDMIGRPLCERRARLEQVVAGSDFVLPVRRLARNGFEAWSEVIAHDFEGLVAKEEASLYEAGPTRRWLKVKQRGWTVDEDRWQRRISAGA